MKTIDSVTLAHVTGGNLASSTQRPPQLPRPQLPAPKPQPQPFNIPGFNPKYPPGSLDLPRRNDIA